MQNRLEVKNSFKLLLLGSAVTVALWFIPLAGLLAYPFRLFVTYVHEIGHALAAIGTLGAVDQIELYADGNGVAWTVGGWRLLVSSAGYLGTTIYGASMLLLLRRARLAKPLALGTGVLLLAVTVIYAGNLLAWVAGLAFGGGLVWLAARARPATAHFWMSFLGVQSLLNAFYDLRTLLYLTAFDGGRPTDAQNMAAATGGLIPAMVWAFGWLAISFAILAFTLWVYYRSLTERETLATPAPTKFEI